MSDMPPDPEGGYHGAQIDAAMGVLVDVLNADFNDDVQHVELRWTTSQGTYSIAKGKDGDQTE